MAFAAQRAIPALASSINRASHFGPGLFVTVYGMARYKFASVDVHVEIYRHMNNYAAVHVATGKKYSPSKKEPVDRGLIYMYVCMSEISCPTYLKPILRTPNIVCNDQLVFHTEIGGANDAWSLIG